MRVSFSGRIKINKSKFNKCLRRLENRGVAQLVARSVRDAEVVGSNPVASTILIMKTDQNFKFWSVFCILRIRQKIRAF